MCTHDARPYKDVLWAIINARIGYNSVIAVVVEVVIEVADPEDTCSSSSCIGNLFLNFVISVAEMLTLLLHNLMRG